MVYFDFWPKSREEENNNSFLLSGNSLTITLKKAGSLISRVKEKLQS